MCFWVPPPLCAIIWRCGKSETWKVQKVRNMETQKPGKVDSQKHTHMEM